MARYKGPIKFSGSLGDVTLTEDGVAKLKSTLNKNKWKSRPKMEQSRKAATVFGGASRCSGAIISRLSVRMRGLARKMAHNYLGARLSTFLRENKGPRDKYDFETFLPMLHRLDLSRSRALGRKLTCRTMGHPLQPEGLHIDGLRDMADAIPPIRNHERKLRLHFEFVLFPLVEWNELHKEWKVDDAKGFRQPSSGWMSPEWIPEQGLDIALSHPRPQQSCLLFIGIEWQQAPMGRTKAPEPDEEAMRNWSVVRVVALYRSAEQMALPVPSYFLPRKTRRYRPPKKAAAPTRAKTMSPPLRFRLASPLDAGLARVRFLPCPSQARPRGEGGPSLGHV